MYSWRFSGRRPGSLKMRRRATTGIGPEAVWRVSLLSGGDWEKIEGRLFDGGCDGPEVDGWVGDEVYGGGGASSGFDDIFPFLSR